jgi:hypothetical protein
MVDPDLIDTSRCLVLAEDIRRRSTVLATLPAVRFVDANQIYLEALGHIQRRGGFRHLIFARITREWRYEHSPFHSLRDGDGI